MAANIFARGAHTMNTMVFKPLRKAYHRNSTETIKETMKLEAEEATTNKSHNLGDHANVAPADGNMWVPHGRTGIYYPKGHEKIMEDVPGPKSPDTVASGDWIYYNEDI